MFFGESFYGTNFSIAAGTLAAVVAAGALAIWRSRRKLAPQPVRVDEGRRRRGRTQGKEK
jgi:hypothetical protein